MTLPLLSSEETIKKLIPQRAPFVLVDSIYEYKDNEILSGFTVPKGHILLNHEGFLSEFGVIEHFAQSIALYQGYNFYLNNLPAPVGYIGSIKNIEIFRLPKMGDLIKTHIQILHELMGVTMVQGEVFLNDEVIALGEMRTIIAKDLE